MDKKFCFYKSGPCDSKDIAELLEYWKTTKMIEHIIRAIVVINDREELVGYVRFDEDMSAQTQQQQFEWSAQNAAFRSDIHYLRVYLDANSGKAEPLFLGYSPNQIQREREPEQQQQQQKQKPNKETQQQQREEEDGAVNGGGSRRRLKFSYCDGDELRFVDEALGRCPDSPEQKEKEIQFFLHYRVRTRPQKKHPEDVGYPITALDGGSVAPLSIGKIATGVYVIPPKGYYAEIQDVPDMSSEGKLNAGGVINNDHREEVIVTVWNGSPIETWNYRPGDVIAQLVVRRLHEEVDAEYHFAESSVDEEEEKLGCPDKLEQKTNGIQFFLHDRVRSKPKKKHPDDSGYELAALDSGSVAPLAVAQIPTGVYVIPPKGFCSEIKDLSNVSAQGRLTVGGGVIDGRGEVIVTMYNASSFETWNYSAGDKIAQLVPRRLHNEIEEEYYFADVNKLIASKKRNSDNSDFWF